MYTTQVTSKRKAMKGISMKIRETAALWEAVTALLIDTLPTTPAKSQQRTNIQDIYICAQFRNLIKLTQELWTS